jgi:hypothetical protein
MLYPYLHEMSPPVEMTIMTTDEPKPRERLTVHLPKEIRQQLEREAKKDRRTLSAFVELALVERFKALAAAQ